MSIHMTVVKRAQTGKVKQLYRDGLVIGNIYGRGQESVPVQADYEAMRKIVEEAGKNHAIEMSVEGDGEHLVLIKTVDRNPATGRLRHVEFQMVNRNEKVEAEIPVELVGTAPAVLAGNMIMTLNDTVLVEANPTSLPDHLEVSAEHLVEPDDLILAGSITLPPSVELKTEPDTPLFKVEVPRSQIEETQEEEVNAADVPSDHGAEITEEKAE